MVNHSLDKFTRTCRNLRAIPQDIESSLSLKIERILDCDISAKLPTPWIETGPPFCTHPFASFKLDPEAVHIRKSLTTLSSELSVDLQAIVVMFGPAEDTFSRAPSLNLTIAQNERAE